MEKEFINTALLIDDDPSCIFILGEFINLIDSTIKKKAAYSVDEALSLLAHSSPFPEVIYVDLNMPIKSGFDFLEHYQLKYYSLYPATKVFVLTSSLRLFDKEKAMSFLCVSDYKSKREIDQFVESSLRIEI